MNKHIRKHTHTHTHTHTNTHIRTNTCYEEIFNSTPPYTIAYEHIHNPDYIYSQHEVSISLINYQFRYSTPNESWLICGLPKLHMYIKSYQCFIPQAIL